MLTVKVVRTVTRPEYRRFDATVQIPNAAILTPAIARQAIGIAFGGRDGATVWGDGYGYRVYPNSVRKVYPALY